MVEAYEVIITESLHWDESRLLGKLFLRQTGWSHLSVAPHLLSAKITVPWISTVKKYTDVDVTIIQLSGLCQNKYAASLSWMCETLRAELKLSFKFTTLDLTIVGAHYDVPNDSQLVICACQY